jgi:hypothetical protein
VVALLRALAEHLPRSRAVDVVSSVLGRPRNEVYRMALDCAAFDG